MNREIFTIIRVYKRLQYFNKMYKKEYNKFLNFFKKLLKFKKLSNIVMAYVSLKKLE